MRMIRPARRLRIACATRCVMAKVTKTLTSNTLRSRASGISESGPVCPMAALAMKTSGFRRSTLATSFALVMSSLSTPSLGAAFFSSAACWSFSTAASTLCPRAASAIAAPRPKPLPAPVISTVFGMVPPRLLLHQEAVLLRPRALAHRLQAAHHRRGADDERVGLHRALLLQLRHLGERAVVARVVGDHHVDALLLGELRQALGGGGVAVQARDVVAEVECGAAPEKRAVRFSRALDLELGRDRAHRMAGSDV